MQGLQPGTKNATTRHSASGAASMRAPSGAIHAVDRVGLMMNAPADRVKKLLSLLPALATPTISKLADEGWVAINTVIEERIVTELFPRLAEAGARGIVEYPLNKIIE